MLLQIYTLERPWCLGQAHSLQQASRLMWRCSLRSSRSVSCCRPCAGEWGWTLQWIQICLWALEPPWWVLPIRSNRTSSTIRNPSLPTHWGDLMPMTHKCWCGGRGGERRLWLSHPNNIEWLIMVVLPSYRGNEGGSEAKSERERERDSVVSLPERF